MDDIEFKVHLCKNSYMDLCDALYALAVLSAEYGRNPVYVLAYDALKKAGAVGLTMGIEGTNTLEESYFGQLKAKLDAK